MITFAGQAIEQKYRNKGGRLSDYNWNIVFRNYELLMHGLAITVQVTLVSVLIGFSIGGIVFARLSKKS